MTTISDIVIKQAKSSADVLTSALQYECRSLIPQIIYTHYKLISTSTRKLDTNEARQLGYSNTVIIVNKYEIHFNDTVYILYTEVNPSTLRLETLKVEKFIESPFLNELVPFENEDFSLCPHELANLLTMGATHPKPKTILEVEKMLHTYLNTEKLLLKTVVVGNNQIDGVITLTNKFGKTVRYSFFATPSMGTIELNLTSLLPNKTPHIPLSLLLKDTTHLELCEEVKQLEDLLYNDVDAVLFSKGDFQVTVADYNNLYNEITNYPELVSSSIELRMYSDLNNDFGIELKLMQDGKYPLEIILWEDTEMQYIVQTYTRALYTDDVKTLESFRTLYKDLIHSYDTNADFLKIPIV